MFMAGIQGMGNYHDQNIMKPIHVLLIANPQIIDEKRILRTYKDMYVRKNWKNVQKAFQPDVVMILGNLLNEGRAWNTMRWESEIHRFNLLFMQIPSFKRVPFFYLPGKHDIGFGKDSSDEAYDRFRKVFGKTNYSFKIGNHSIVAIDTVSGQNNDLSFETTHFIEKLGKNPNKEPRILFTHLPLYQPPNTKCEPRQHNLINETSSNFVLKNVRPKLVFSGDNHDYCEIQHEPVNAMEVTVNSFNFAKNPSKPGFAMLSLYNPFDSSDSNQIPTYAYSQCFLPNPYGITLSYIYMKRLPRYWKIAFKELTVIAFFVLATYLCCL
ncbi:7242_t:CDS:2, partial [Ambispora leptoticha]